MSCNSFRTTNALKPDLDWSEPRRGAAETAALGLPQEHQSGLRAIIEIKIDMSRVIFEDWSSNLYLRMSYEHKLASRINQSIGDHNFSWNSLRFINFQWSQRTVLLSYTTVCRIMFWLHFWVSTGSHAGFDSTSAPQKKTFRPIKMFDQIPSIDLPVAF